LKSSTITGRFFSQYFELERDHTMEKVMFNPNLLPETRLSFAQLAHKERVAIATVWRWDQSGIRGVRLESLKIGGRKFTTAEAFERFIVATNGGFSNQPTINRTLSDERLKAIEKTEAELADFS
jgi:Protein of unknown function (DUF1580)